MAWIEIYNRGTTTIDLTDIKIGDEETKGDLEGMLRFPDGAVISPTHTLIIAWQADQFFTVYGFYPDYEIQDTTTQVANLNPYTNWANGDVLLAALKDEVLILDEKDQVIDAVSWGGSNWAFKPDVAVVATGHSIERRPANKDTNTNSDWLDQANPGPGQVNLNPAPGLVQRLFNRWLFTAPDPPPAGSP